jgi:hypothetical protein
MLKPGGAAVLALDGGSPEFEFRRLPVRRGSSSFQGLEDAAGARHQCVWLLAGVTVLLEDLFVISILLGCLLVTYGF